VGLRERRVELWDNALAEMRDRLASQHFENWLVPLEASLEGETLVLRAQNSFAADWIRRHYLTLIRDTIRSQASEQHVDVRLDVAPGSLRTTDDDPPSEAPTASPAEPKPTPRLPPRLNPKYTFASYVVGPSNQLAHAAASAVANQPGRKYNPLFICGGVGLGKTHLASAIGHHIATNLPGLHIEYLSAEEFTNDFIDCLQHHRMEDFRHRYRVACDVLLVDDIQFLATRNQTQEEFFHTFNALYDHYQQIVITSDKYPKEIPELEERLVSRFEWGLVADIQAPELETRVAILRKKALVEGIQLPDDVAFHVAERIQSNVRELEGTLIRVAAKASLLGRPLDLDLARECLQVTAPLPTPNLTVEDILRAVCSYFNLKLGEIKSPRRHRSVSFPRQIAMYLCRHRLGLTYPAIGDRFGGKDHSTVISACRKIQDLVERDAGVRAALTEIEKRAGLRR
jgi:chromosomal replication initiator protein